MKEFREEVREFREEQKKFRKEQKEFREEQRAVNEGVKEGLREGKVLGEWTIAGSCLAIVAVLGLDEKLREWGKKKAINAAKRVRDFCRAGGEGERVVQIEMRELGESRQGAEEGGGGGLASLPKLSQKFVYLSKNFGKYPL